MTTLATMKSRIADELARSDLTSQIANAINDAIERYQPERFWFNESRDVTFTTAPGTSSYTALGGDLAGTADLYAIDYLLLASSQNVLLHYLAPERIEYLLNSGSTTGKPYTYSYYNRAIRLYPAPSGTWTVRVGGHIRKPAPASDGEAGNVWMTDAERLIRARAKYNLALDVLRDGELATAMAAAVTEALEQLKSRSSRQASKGNIAAMAF